MTRVDEIRDWPERLSSVLAASACSYAELLRCLNLPDDGGWLQAALQGRAVPSMSNLAALSAYTGLPLATLVADAPSKPSLAMALRAGLETVKGDTTHARNHAQTVLANRSLLLSWFPDERDRVAKSIAEARRAISGSTWAQQAGQQTAQRLRDILELGDAPIVDLVSILENFGVPVQLEELPKTLQGLTITDDSSGSRASVVFVNSEDWWGRQRYTLAHELCHVLFNDPGVVFIESKHVDTGNTAEYRCEVFARHFLAPPGAVRFFWEENREMYPLMRAGALLPKFMMSFGVSRQTALNIFRQDLNIPPEFLTPYKDVKISTMMKVAGLGKEWHEACLIQDEQSPSAWLLNLALDAYGAGYVDTAIVASVLNRQDVDAVERELHEMGWRPDTLV